MAAYSAAVGILETSVGGSQGTATPVPFFESVEPPFEETLPPLGDDLPTDIEPRRDLRVIKALCCHKDDFGAYY
jgi:hypothetical protein